MRNISHKSSTLRPTEEDNSHIYIFKIKHQAVIVKQTHQTHNKGSALAFWQIFEQGLFINYRTPKSIQANILPSLGMWLTDARPLKQISDWLAVVVTSSSSFPEEQRSNLKAVIGRRKSLK